MNTRLKLHAELVEVLDNVYFQPPADIRMKYPCIVYHKSGKYREYADNIQFREMQLYQVTVISPDPDNQIADILERSFQHCYITNYMVVDHLSHTQLTLYY